MISIENFEIKKMDQKLEQEMDQKMDQKMEQEIGQETQSQEKGIWRRYSDFLKILSDLGQDLNQNPHQNQLQWLTRPYNLSRHFRELGKDYQFFLEHEGWIHLGNQEIFERKTTHRFIKNADNNSQEKILAWGRVLIPKETYEKYQEAFGDLKNSPIGEKLFFSNPEVRRSEFEYQYFKDSGHYARRSVFYWRNLPIWVEEIFAEDLPVFKPIKYQTNHSFRLKQKFLDSARLMRLHRPIPILLMLWPTLWALWLAEEHSPSFKLLFIFILGVFLMRSCGDILNDLADRKLDAQVERTRDRPLVTQRLSVKEACFLALILAVLSFGLVLFLNPLCIFLSFIGAALALIYPWMKRWTYGPQIFLGFAYNFGILMAFAAVRNTIPLVAWSWWVLAAVWTLSYDSFYAMADYKDDNLIGVKSTIVLWEKYNLNSLNIILLLQILCFLGAVFLGYLGNFSWVYYLCLLACVPFGMYQRKLIKNIKFKPKNSIHACINAFNNNHWIGLLIFLGISAQFY